MSSVYFPNDHTPEEWRDMARAAHARSAESFERSDTDGYLSQWAGDKTGQLYSLCARVAENGGVWDFPALADASGKLIPGAREVCTRYGWSWVWDGPDGAVWFTASQARTEEARQASNLRRGYQVVTVSLPAGVIMRGETMLNVHPDIIPLNKQNAR